MKVSKDGETFLEAEVASSFVEKMKGLMFEYIDEDEGLLMKFDSENERKVWMPFVPEDLGLIFLNSDGEVVGKERAERITLDPSTWKIYSSPVDCQYILECHPQKLNMIEEGEVMRW